MPWVHWTPPPSVHRGLMENFVFLCSEWYGGMLMIQIVCVKNIFSTINYYAVMKCLTVKAKVFY